MSTATVTSQRPTLHWSLADGTDGARVDLCNDRACSHIVSTFVASGTSAAPPNALAAGVYFWRLHGTSAGAVGSPTSPTWEFFVGARTAPVDTSWGTVPDVNGDGFADVILGGNGDGAYVYLGGAGGLTTTPFTIEAAPGVLGISFAQSLASAGDVDGDGYADVVVSALAQTSNGAAALALLYRGGEGGLSPTPATTLSIPFATTYAFGTSVAGAGDVNGDGYADVLLSSTCMGCTSAIAVYLGSSTGLPASPATTLQVFIPTADQVPLIPMTGAGDVNGDGFADVVVGIHALGDVELFTGGANGISSPPAMTITTPSGQVAQLGSAVAAVGDLDGDGFADVAVRSEDTALTPISVYGGSATGLSETPAATVWAITGNGGICCGAIAGGGDVNGDGFADLVVDEHLTMTTGTVDVYLGGAGGLDTTAWNTIAGPAASPGPFGAAITNAGDVNGDGFADVLISGSLESDAAGQSFLYLGASTGLPATPTVTILPPSGVDGLGFGSEGALVHGGETGRLR